MPLGQIASQYKARAGALTLSYLNSTLGWDQLRAILAQSATGAALIDLDALVIRDTAAAVDDIFADRYLIEPANPGDDPDDVETPMRPTPAGREVPFVGATLHRWLERCPRGPVAAGKGSGDVLWPLLSSWVGTVVHAVAAKPRSAAEIQEAIGVLPLEVVEANVDLLSGVELIHFSPPERPDGEERIEPTNWLRLAVAPLAAAARMELRHPREDVAPIAAADVVAALQLALPLLRSSRGLSGACTLSVGLDEGIIGSPVAMTARIERRRVACELGTDPQADAWVAGSTAAWLDAVIDRDTGRLETGGDERLAGAVLKGLHKRLFA